MKTIVTTMLGCCILSTVLCFTFAGGSGVLLHVAMDHQETVADNTALCMLHNSVFFHLYNSIAQFQRVVVDSHSNKHLKETDIKINRDLRESVEHTIQECFIGLEKTKLNTLRDILCVKKTIDSFITCGDPIKQSVTTDKAKYADIVKYTHWLKDFPNIEAACVFVAANIILNTLIYLSTEEVSELLHGSIIKEETKQLAAITLAEALTKLNQDLPRSIEIVSCLSVSVAQFLLEVTAMEIQKSEIMQSIIGKTLNLFEKSEEAREKFNLTSHTKNQLNDFSSEILKHVEYVSFGKSLDHFIHVCLFITHSGALEETLNNSHKSSTSVLKLLYINDIKKAIFEAALLAANSISNSLTLYKEKNNKKTESKDNFSSIEQLNNLQKELCDCIRS